jgi:hypothetical protein
MRALTTAIILAILAPLVQPAFAAETEALTRRSDQQKKEDEEVDKAYKAATRNGAAPAKVDPWATVRPADTDAKNKH